MPVAAEDRRLKLVEATMKKHQYQGHALIEVLHTAQEVFGYLEPDLLRHVARKLRLPPSRVYGVATFYHFFSLSARGLHTCVVCTGTACYVKGADALLKEFAHRLGIEPGETTSDGRISLRIARCLGACGLAPVAVFDQDVAGNLTPELTSDRINLWSSDGRR